MNILSAEHANLLLNIIISVLGVIVVVLGWSLKNNYNSVIGQIKTMNQRIDEVEKEAESLRDSIGNVKNNYTKQFSDIHICINEKHDKMMDKIGNVEKSIAVLLYALHIKNPSSPNEILDKS